ncbi:iron complex transport system permease protein [Tamaricihabitans halophyticus]|uniref:Iron complex transport system permease protein n=1 Tax=Tamaricihabitans halophyticus TaxID=1262583 RepID=A0A4R2QJ14_9PSEU|nr:iron chelate uptake ABC transporter family permease subunit [Tamaricihabitans halophyticus]TCP48458.1 iron complex transport system permease protein [Tamaricihabitans halophyticus]
MTGPAVQVIARARGRETARVRVVSAGLALAVLGVFTAGIAYGDFTIGVPDLLGSLVGSAPGPVEFVVHRLRLPRALTGLLVGFAFGLAGAIFQRLLRNPLASPDVIGVTSGASAIAMLSILVLGATGAVVSFAALLGAVLAASVIYLLSWRGGISGYRLVLIGIGIGAALTSIVSFLLTRAGINEAARALVWLTGSLYGSSWERIVPLVAFLVVLVPAAFLVSRMLPGLQLGDDQARGLGLPVERARLGLLLTGVALAGVATASAGPVAFVAFVSGPIAARLVGGARAALLPSALVGALVTLTADFVAQHLFGGQQFPVGVVTGVVGAPYLLWLLAMTNRAGRGG